MTPVASTGLFGRTPNFAPPVPAWVDLYHEDTGGPGTPVVFLHAATGTCDGWVHQVPAFTAAGCRCIAYDRRTWGRSKPTGPERQLGFAGDDLHALDYAHPPAEGAESGGGHTNGGVQDETYLEVQRPLRSLEIQELPVELR